MLLLSNIRLYDPILNSLSIFQLCYKILPYDQIRHNNNIVFAWISMAVHYNADFWYKKFLYQDRLCQICNEIFESNKAPKQFTTNLIVPLPKKGVHHVQHTEALWNTRKEIVNAIKTIYKNSRSAVIVEGKMKFYLIFDKLKYR